MARGSAYLNEFNMGDRGVREQRQVRRMMATAVGGGLDSALGMVEEASDVAIMAQVMERMSRDWGVRVGSVAQTTESEAWLSLIVPEHAYATALLRGLALNPEWKDVNFDSIVRRAGALLEIEGEMATLGHQWLGILVETGKLSGFSLEEDSEIDAVLERAFAPSGNVERRADGLLEGEMRIRCEELWKLRQNGASNEDILIERRLPLEVLDVVFHEPVLAGRMVTTGEDREGDTLFSRRGQANIWDVMREMRDLAMDYGAHGEHEDGDGRVDHVAEEVSADQEENGGQENGGNEELLPREMLADIHQVTRELEDAGVVRGIDASDQVADKDDVTERGVADTAETARLSVDQKPKSLFALLGVEMPVAAPKAVEVVKQPMAQPELPTEEEKPVGRPNGSARDEDLAPRVKRAERWAHDDDEGELLARGRMLVEAIDANNAEAVHRLILAGGKTFNILYGMLRGQARERLVNLPDGTLLRWLRQAQKAAQVPSSSGW